MRLTLVDNLLYESSYSVRRADLQPHLGLMSLAAAARKAGHESTIYDPKWDVFRGRLSLDASLYERFARAVFDTNPDVVGFTALGCNFHCVVKVASSVKRAAPELPILLGGPHATILHREILGHFPAFDVVVRNEAEETIAPLLARLESRDLVELAGISYRGRNGDILANCGMPIIEDLDTLPRPDYEQYPLSELGFTSIRVEAGRGCPFSCTFCSTASFFGRQYRLKSTPRLIAEMDYLHNAYGYTDFKLNHDLFTVNRKKVAEFCAAAKNRRYTWSCSARVDCVDDELLEQMKEAGCANIYFGVETASARMQAISRKRLDVSLVEPTLDVTGRLGIATTTSFIVGYPEETLADQEETLDCAARLHCRPDGQNRSQVHLLTPEPGTELIAQYKNSLRFDGHVSEFNFPMLQADDRELIASHPDIFSNHHHFPGVLPRERHVFVTSAWPVLWLLGPALLRYLLIPFDGRLSHFVDEALRWHVATGSHDWNVGSHELEGFLVDRFGRQHHLVSLFRYAQAVDRMFQAVRTAKRQASRPTDADPRDLPLSTSAAVAVLRDVHDCLELNDRLRSLSGDQLLTDAGPLLHLVLVAEPPAKEGERGSVSAYEIDAATADLLERFERPTSYWQCCRDIAESDEESAFPDWAELESLCRMGVLEMA